MSRREELIAKHSAKAGLRGKVDAYCIYCVYEQGNGGTWVQQVSECTVNHCPLYTVRKGARSPIKEGSAGQVDREDLINGTDYSD